MISFIDVNKFLLSEVTLHIPEGISVGIIGETGSGKTTFLKLACGLLRPERGEVYTMGLEPVANQKKLTRSIGVLFAHLPLLQAEESVWSNLENRGLMYGMSVHAFQTEAWHLSHRLGLNALLQEKVKNLSLGQRRRAELAAVFLPNPRLLLLDEPTVGLDQNGKNAFRNFVQERSLQGLTTVITSHDMSDISATCNRIAILSHGRFCAYGNQEQLLKQYAPMDVMQITLQAGIPNLEDLPIQSYCITDNRMTLRYNSNHITSAEILKTLVSHCSIQEISIRKPSLEDVIIAMKKGEK